MIALVLSFGIVAWLFSLAVLVVLLILALPIMWLNVPEGKVAVLYLKFSPHGTSKQAVAYQIEQEPPNSRRLIRFVGSGYKEFTFEPGLHFFAYSPLFHRVEVEDWARNDATAPAYVISQIGDPLPAGRRFVFMNGGPEIFESVQKYLESGGEIGEHAMVLGSFNRPLHPAAFLVVTKTRVFGIPYNAALMQKKRENKLTFVDFGFSEDDFRLNVVPEDKIGLITLRDGGPMPQGLPVYLHGGWDVFIKEHDRLCEHYNLPKNPTEQEEWQRNVVVSDEIRKNSENEGKTEEVLKSEVDWLTDRWPKEMKLGNDLLRLVREWNNASSNNYQQPGKNVYAGPQLVPLLEGSYLHNRHLVTVEVADYTNVEGDSALAIVPAAGPQGFDITPASFTYNDLVRPGFMGGIWSIAVGPGTKYPFNTKFLGVDSWVTSVMVLYWSSTQSEHGFDTNLGSIQRLSKDKVNMTVDLNVKLVIPKEAVPFCRARFGTQKRFVNEFMKAEVTSFVMAFIEENTAEAILAAQEELGKLLRDHLVAKLKKYNIDVRDVLFETIKPEESYYKIVNAKTLADMGIKTAQSETKLAEAETKRNKQRGIAKATQVIEEARGDVERRRLMIQAVKETIGLDAAASVAVAQELTGGKHPGLPGALALSGPDAGGYMGMLPMILKAVKDAGGQPPASGAGSESGAPEVSPSAAPSSSTT